MTERKAIDGRSDRRLHRLPAAVAPLKSCSGLDWPNLGHQSEALALFQTPGGYYES